MTDTKSNAGVAVMRKSKLISGLIGGVCVGCLALPGTAFAQFGGFPTKTPQDITDKSKIKDEDKPGYLVVDQRYRGENSYTTIQSAIDAVAPGGVVVVMPGEYNENLVLTKAVNLQGDRGPGSRVRIAPTDAGKPCLNYRPEKENQHAQISNIEFTTTKMPIDSVAGQPKASNVDYFASNPCILVQGGVFTMKETTVNGLVNSNSRDYYGVSAADYANNSIAESYYSRASSEDRRVYKGVLVDIAGGTAFLEKNTIRGGMEGVRVSQDHPLWDRTLLVDNKITENNLRGLHLASASGVQATGNLIENNGIGIAYNGEGDATIVGNKILNNANDGVLLGENAKQVLLSLNEIARNEQNGIKVIRATGTISNDNIFEGNGWGGDYFYDVNTMDAGYNNLPKIGNEIYVNVKADIEEQLEEQRQERRRGWFSR